MVYAISIYRRTIAEACSGAPFHHYWYYYRFRWAAKFAVWWINHLGAGPFYEYAKFLGETL